MIAQHLAMVAGEEDDRIAVHQAFDRIEDAADLVVDVIDQAKVPGLTGSQCFAGQIDAILHAVDSGKFGHSWTILSSDKTKTTQQ